MIKIENIKVSGFEAAARGMRNPKNSWGSSDSVFCREMCEICEYQEVCYTISSEELNPELWEKLWEDDSLDFAIGKNDMRLMQNLIKAGPEHRTFMRMIMVWMDVEAPRRWWQEADRYSFMQKISTSTVHKIMSRYLTDEDFSMEMIEKDEEALNCHRETVRIINKHIEQYKLDHEPDHFQIVKDLLPENYNQKRTIMISYETALNMIRQREHHPVREWKPFCEALLRLPYMRELMER